MPNGEQERIDAEAAQFLSAAGVIKEPVSGDLTPDEVAYVQRKLAGISDIERVKDLRAKEVALPFVTGGRPAALAAYDARIKQLEAPKEG